MCILQILLSIHYHTRKSIKIREHWVKNTLKYKFLPLNNDESSTEVKKRYT